MLFKSQFSSQFNSVVRKLTSINILSGVFFLWAGTGYGQETNPVEFTDIPAQLQVVISGHNLPSNSYTFRVEEVNSATALLDVNSNIPFNPASTMKTVTTLAALETLGPAYTWQTRVYAMGNVVDDTLEGDLLIQGGGDPFLVEEHFRNMLKAIQRRGIKRITGDLILDGSYFDASVSEQTILDNQRSRAYNVLPHGLMTNFQTVTFYFSPDSNGRDVKITAEPDLPNIRINNQLRQRNAACGGYQRGVSFDVDPADPRGVVFSGQFPARCSEYQLVRAVLDAENYTYGFFKKMWQELGGEFNGALKLDSAPTEQQPLLTWLSPPLGDVIKSINKYSNNLMTRQLLLTMGAEAYETPATVEKGIQAVNDYISSKGLDASQVNIANGSGLAREVRITTEVLVALLREGYKSKYMPEYLTSLPLAGMDGTMRYRLRDRGTRGSMHVKTGSLDEVSAVAGYVYSRSGKVFLVSGIVNHELADRGPGVELLDALLGWVYLQ